MRSAPRAGQPLHGPAQLSKENEPQPEAVGEWAGGGRGGQGASEREAWLRGEQDSGRDSTVLRPGGQDIRTNPARLGCVSPRHQTGSKPTVFIKGIN